VPNDFPFHNRSFPGGPDSDVLPYPGPADRRGKQSKRNDKQHFFLLMVPPREANEYKEKEKEEKLAKEKEKQERISKRSLSSKRQSWWIKKKTSNQGIPE